MEHGRSEHFLMRERDPSAMVRREAFEPRRNAVADGTDGFTAVGSAARVGNPRFESEGLVSRDLGEPITLPAAIIARTERLVDCRIEQKRLDNASRADGRAHEHAARLPRC